MRSLRNSLAAAWVLALAPTLAVAEPKPKDLLNLCVPTQKGVEYDTPTDPAAIDACKVEIVVNAQKKSIGYALRDGQGKLLRRFVDADGNGSLDQWSYYQDGFEVYREIDLNGDKVADECRWMNAGGTRVAAVVKGKVAAWKRISAEEASKVLVQALVSGDLALLETVLATPDELSALGVPKGLVDQVAAAAARRVEQVRALQKGLTGWDSKTVWNRLDGMMPHLIPAEAGGLKGDLTLYENAVIFAGPANGPSNPAQVAFLQVPELIKIGEVWKFVELPRAVDASKPVVASEGGLRSWLYRGESAGAAPASNPKLEAALKELAQYDNAAPNLSVAKEVAQFHVGRIPLLRAVVKAAQNPDEQLVYDKQIVDSLAAAYQTGLYPKGLEPLNVYIEQGGKAGSYAAFRKLSAEFSARNDEPGANVMQSQKKWMADLKAFLDKYPKADEAPDALLQLASINEFNAEEDEARKYYDRLARDFPADRRRQEGRRRPAAARPGRQAVRAEGDRPAGRDDRHRPVPRQDGARHLLGHLGRPGQARPARADQGVPEAPRPGLRGRRRLPRQRARRPRRVPQGDAPPLAAGLRAGRPGEEPAGGRVRHHRAADDDPGRPPGQGRQPQHPDGRRAGEAVGGAPRGQDGRRRARLEVTSGDRP